MKKTVKVLRDTKVYFKGNSQVIKAGASYPEDAQIVQENKHLFVSEEPKKEAPKKVQPKKEEPKKEEPKKEEPKKNTKRSKKEDKKPELKEELLIEEPVSVLEVTEEFEITEESEEK
jgi:hypothetical protein